MSNMEDENKIIEMLINKKNNKNEKFKKILDDKIITWMNQIDKTNDINKEMEKEIDDECLMNSIIELIEKKNKEIEKLKSSSRFDINKYKLFLSV